MGLRSFFFEHIRTILIGFGIFILVVMVHRNTTNCPHPPALQANLPPAAPVQPIDHEPAAAVEPQTPVVASTLTPTASMPKLGISTLVLSDQGYRQGALVLCDSMRELAGKDVQFGQEIDLIAFVPQDYAARQIDIESLKCCFTHIIPLEHVKVSRPSRIQRFQEQYIKLRLWNLLQYKRLIYMDADFLVTNFKELNRLLHTDIPFGAVQDWNNGEFSPWWNGGFFIVEPNKPRFDDLMSSVDRLIAENKYDTDKSEQAYLSAYYVNMGYTLPTVFNFNLALRRDIWDRYWKDCVAIHYTVAKPWESGDGWEPMALWRKHRDILKAKGCAKI
jgi:hypothetical protein